MPLSPEEKRFTDHQPLSYYLASSFTRRKDAEQPYQRVQEIIYDPKAKLELSAFRFQRQLHDPQLPLEERSWFVVVVGDQPSKPVELKLREALSLGEMATLPLETLLTLNDRRAQATKIGPWVEGHYGERIHVGEATVNVQRRNPNKDKLKRKMQKKSRRQNRRK